MHELLWSFSQNKSTPSQGLKPKKCCLHSSSTLLLNLETLFLGSKGQKSLTLESPKRFAHAYIENKPVTGVLDWATHCFFAIDQLSTLFLHVFLLLSCFLASLLPHLCLLQCKLRLAPLGVKNTSLFMDGLVLNSVFWQYVYFKVVFNSSTWQVNTCIC